MTNQNVYLRLKDHSVSGEEFELFLHEEMDMLETVPRPLEKRLRDYYKSDDYISHTDSRRNLLEFAYHFMRKIALKRKLKLINSFDTDTRSLLDIGCGTGDFLRTAANDNWQVTGIEPDEQARAIANGKVNQRVFNSTELEALEPKSFDVITMWHVLEHLPSPKKHISLIKDLLKPNGIVLIAVPNFKSFDAGHYEEFWAAYDVPRHLWHFSRHSISELFKRENLTLVKTLPMVYDAYYVSLLSEKYKSGFMNPLKAFYIGTLSNLKARQTKEYSSHIYILKDQIS